MSPTGRILVLLGGLAAGLAPPVQAQIPDTTVVDSTGRDTTDYSALFIKSAEEGRRRVPVLPRLGGPHLLPAMTRVVFTRDTIDWHNTETLADLLSKVPGVYVWRGGWIGRPEPINYQARGARSVEYLLDGVPLIPLGPDSVSIDPSLTPMSFLERVEVERLPGLLRVHLYTRRHDRSPPVTRVGVASGDFDIARYEGLLAKRFGSGIGLVVAAEHLAVPLASSQQGSYSNTQGWLQASFVPSPRWAANLQLFRAGASREDVLATTLDGDPIETDTLSAGFDGTRTDLHASLSYAPGGGSLGARLSLLLGYSSWSEDSTTYTLGPLPPHQHVKLIDQSVYQVGGQASLRTGTMFGRATAWYRSRWTPLEVRVEVGATPTSRLAGAVEAMYQKHDGGRNSRSVTFRGGVELPLGFRASATLRAGKVVAAPSIEADLATDIRDAGVQVAFERPRVALEVGYWRTSAFAPRPFPLYRTISGITPTTKPTEWRTVSARLAPRQWLILDGWYSDAVGTGIEGVPPTHSIVNATIQSKFLPTFRSGIFGLKLQGSMETFGTGTIGQGKDGVPIVLRGATFFRGLIQLHIGSFSAYYDRVNLQASRLAYVPGLPILRLASTFGVRWEFSN